MTRWGGFRWAFSQLSLWLVVSSGSTTGFLALSSCAERSGDAGSPSVEHRIGWEILHLRRRHPYGMLRTLCRMTRWGGLRWAFSPLILLLVVSPGSTTGFPERSRLVGWAVSGVNGSRNPPDWACRNHPGRSEVLPRMWGGWRWGRRVLVGQCGCGSIG